MPDYGVATSGVTGARSAPGGPPAPPAAPAPSAPPLAGADGRTTTVSTSNGVTRVIVRTPGTATTLPGTPVKPMMSPADAANVIRRP